MPAYPTHTLFSHMALVALVESRHPLAGVAQAHASTFRIAGIAGCDIQCMPYQVCRNCDAPYRHNQRENRVCLVCGEPALEEFSVPLPNGSRIKRVDIERDLYRNTHLVLGRRPRAYGVAPNTPAGPPDQPFPPQVVRHLANVLRDAEKIAGPEKQTSAYLAFTLGWFTHVVSDAIFKGVYPHAVQVQFFGKQYDMEMLPAAEALTMTDISHDFGVHWPTWHDELLHGHPDGGALRHLAMGNPAERYDPEYWTEEFGEPNPEIGLILDAVQPVNRTWLHRMYRTPDYSAPTPRLDQRDLRDRARWTFNGLDLGQLRAYAIGTGWYDCFLKGIQIYLRVIDDAVQLVGENLVIPTPAGSNAHLDEPPRSAGPLSPSFPSYDLWSDILAETLRERSHPADWGSQLNITAEASAVLHAVARRPVAIILPERFTDYQKQIADVLISKWRIQPRPDAPLKIVIGPPTFHSEPEGSICHEEILRLKYDTGLAAIATYDPDAHGLHLVGLSDFGDQKLLDWLATRAP